MGVKFITRRDKKVEVRLTATERRDLVQCSRRLRLRQSEFVRRAIADFVRKNGEEYAA